MMKPEGAAAGWQVRQINEFKGWEVDNGLIQVKEEGWTGSSPDSPKKTPSIPTLLLGFTFYRTFWWTF